MDKTSSTYKGFGIRLPKNLKTQKQFCEASQPCPPDIDCLKTSHCKPCLFSE